MSLEDNWDDDWDDDAEDQLRAIEATYAATKRGSSTLDTRVRKEQSNQRRRLPGWANGASRSGSSTLGLHSVNGYQISKLDGPSSSCRQTGFQPFYPISCQDNLKIKRPAFTFDGRSVYSRTSTEVELATIEILDKISQLKHNAVEVSLGFDIEWRPFSGTGQPPPKAAVLQICLDSSACYVMHIIHSGVPPILKSLLEDPSSFKVGVGIAGDAMKMSRDYKICTKSLLDLSSYANLKLGGPSKIWGLASLVEKLTCKELLKPKNIRMGNWEVNVLSKEQLHYASTDAFASWYLYQVLKTFPDPKPEES